MQAFTYSGCCAKEEEEEEEEDSSNYTNNTPVVKIRLANVLKTTILLAWYFHALQMQLKWEKLFLNNCYGNVLLANLSTIS